MLARTLALALARRLSVPCPATTRALSTHPARPNDAIIHLLAQNLQDENASPSRNAYKVRSFQTAINAVKRAQHPILTGQDAAKLKGIGPGIAQRIEFFLNGKDYVPVKHDKELREKDKSMALLQTVPGIGARTAAELVDAGCTSLKDLHRREYYFKFLTKTQRAKLDHAEHLRQEVTRADAENVAAFIRHHIASQFELHLMGDYRRDRPTCPKIELLLLHPSYVHVPAPPAPPAVHFPQTARGNRPQPFRPKPRARAPAPPLDDAVRPLRDAGLLVAPLHAYASKWQGIALLPERAEAGAGGEASGWAEVGERLRDIRARRGSYRAIELNMAPVKSRGAAVLALTGDAEFLASLRIAATRLGMYLNEYGLWRWHANRRSDASAQDPHAAAAADVSEESAKEGFAKEEAKEEKEEESGYWELIQAESEAAIFEELGMPWVPPEKRNFEFLKEKRPSARRGRPRKTPPGLL